MKFHVYTYPAQKVVELKVDAPNHSIFHFMERDDVAKLWSALGRALREMPK